MVIVQQHFSSEGVAVTEQERGERRLRKRYVVSTRARYRWQDASGTWLSEIGTTLNVSVAGVYVLTSSIPPAGVALEIKLGLPMAGSATNRGCLFGKGVVTRVDKESGFAAKVDLKMLRVRDRNADAME